MKRDMSKYEKVRGSLDTGDIVLFSGTGFISRMIQTFSRSIWSHVGMVIKSVDWDMILLWESTTLSKIKDIESREQTQGVQLVPLSERVKCYANDKVAFRKLEGVRRDENMREVLRKFRQDMKGREYEKSKFELLKAAYDGPFGANEEDLSSIFCSELVAEAYQRMGLLMDNEEMEGYVPSNEWTPGDFADWTNLQNDARLGNLIYV